MTDTTQPPPRARCRVLIVDDNPLIIRSVTRLLTHRGYEVVTADSTVATWSEALGREIVYGGEDMDAWERQNAQYLPAAVAYDFRLMYEFFQREGLRATDEAIERQTELLGHPPRDFAAFARETAAAWRDRSSAG